MSGFVRNVVNPRARPWFPWTVIFTEYLAYRGLSDGQFVAGKFVKRQDMFIGTYVHFHSGALGLDGVD